MNDADCSDMCMRVCALVNVIFFFASSFTRIDGPSVAPAFAAYNGAYNGAYNSAYGLSSAHYSAPKLAITPAVSKVIATPAVSTYYSANKLAYSTPSLIKQVSYGTAAPPLQYISPSVSTAHGSAYGLANAAYSVAPAAKYVSTGYTNPAAITSSYVAANKFAYTGPNVATQYAASYTPSLAASYVSAPIAKQVSYATNPLLGGAAYGYSGYNSGYKTGAAYVAPAVATTTLHGGAGIVKTAGYHSSSLGYIALLGLVLLVCLFSGFELFPSLSFSDTHQPKRLSHRLVTYHLARIWLRQIFCQDMEELN